jgi:metal iron transporter
MAGQLVCEGAMNWRMKPIYRRLLTRCIAIIPGIIVAAADGRSGLANALNGCNVVLSVALIFLTFPLIWYTSFKKYMMVQLEVGASSVTLEGEGDRDVERVNPMVSLANNIPTTAGAWIVWLIISSMNVATLVFLGLGVSGD